jgi:hypothetical protein
MTLKILNKDGQMRHTKTLIVMHVIVTSTNVLKYGMKIEF